MLFKGHQDVYQRLAGDKAPLSLEEIRELRSWARNLDEGNLRRLYVELGLLNHEAVLMNKAAIEQFDESSMRFGNRLWWLTVILAVLTGIMTWATVMMAFGDQSS